MVVILKRAIEVVRRRGGAVLLACPWLVGDLGEVECVRCGRMAVRIRLDRMDTAESQFYLFFWCGHGLRRQETKVSYMGVSWQQSLGFGLQHNWHS